MQKFLLVLNSFFSFINLVRLLKKTDRRTYSYGRISPDLSAKKALLCYIFSDTHLTLLYKISLSHNFEFTFLEEIVRIYGIEQGKESKIHYSLLSTVFSFSIKFCQKQVQTI